ncbi:MAG: septum formation initiator family protein [Proteobacteria bacterium]|nr:septum formation initiator family protein [Pseudomonadota bacterium]
MHSATIRRRKSNGRIGTLFFACVFFYFSYHAVSGHNGLLTLFQLHQQLDQAYAELDKVQTNKMELEHRVGMLSETIDLDLLDEQSRRMLNYSKPNEKMYLIPAGEMAGAESTSPAKVHTP